VKAVSKAGKEESFLVATSGSYSAEMEGAFQFWVSFFKAGNPIERVVRRIREGFDAFSVSLYSPDKTRKEPLISVTCETVEMRASAQQFLDGCPSLPATKACP
jgi:hypothetical protein